MYKEEPLLRKSEFLNSEIYDHYLKNNPILHNVVFEHFILQDEQWIRFIHVHLFIFSHAFLWSISNDDEFNELEEYYQELWGDNFNKIKLIIYDFEPNLKPGIDIYYAEYGTYYFKCYEWERSMYKMFEELNPYHFNKYYVQEKLRNYLDKIGNDCDDNKILNHLSNCKFEIEFDKNGKQHSCMCCLDDELCLIENLDIAQIVDEYTILITKDDFTELENTGVCKKIDEGWKLYLYKVDDPKLLKKLGIYDEILHFIRKVERVYSKFISGDYSYILSSTEQNESLSIF
jgi:hypothetical protein